MIVRPTVAADLPALQDVLDQTGLFPSEMLPDLIMGYLSQAVSDELWLTCKDGSTPIGFAYAKAEALTDGTWNMLAIAVSPTRHRSGAGGALVAKLEALLREQGHRILIAETSGLAEFQDARNFYRGNGYAEEARIREFWGKGDDKIVFWKAL